MVTLTVSFKVDKKDKFKLEIICRMVKDLIRVGLSPDEAIKFVASVLTDAKDNPIVE